MTIWSWRYEVTLVAALGAMAFGVGFAFGAVWLIASAATGLALLAAVMVWPRSRRRLIARAWCVITAHRVVTGCAQAWIQSRGGRLPVVLYTNPARFGERVMLWCRAGITARDFEAAREILAVACWAKDVRVLASQRHKHLVMLEVVRREPAPVHHGTPRGWPSRTGEAEPEEPATEGADRWTEPLKPLRRLQAGPGVTRLPPASGSLPLPPGPPYK